MNFNLGHMVSVIMAVHQDNEFFDLSIKSLLNQTYDNFEIIIVANGCSDAFLSRLKEISVSDSRISLVATKIKYLPFALNLGIHNAKGYYIARMDSDDVSHPERITRQVSYLDEHDSVGIVGSNVNYINIEGEVIGRSNYSLDDMSIREKIFSRSQFAHPSVMFRRHLIEEMGGYMFGNFSEDYDLWIRLARNDSVKFANIAECLLDYRIHPSQATNKNNAKNIFAYDFSLKVRELLLNFKCGFVRGLVVTFIHFLYARFFRKS